MSNDLEMALEQFDIERFVEEHVGEIISRSDFGTQLRAHCPFCEAGGDRKGKFYVSTVKKLVFCQRCRYGAGKDTIQFIADVEDISRAEVIRLLIESVGRSFGTFNDMVDRLVGVEEPEEAEQPLSVFAREHTVEIPNGSVQLFTGGSGMMAKRAEKYLLKRGITRRQRKRHEFFYCGRGKYRNRIVVPVYYGEHLVHWVARDLGGRAISKYVTPPESEQSYWLYNWNNVKDKDSVVVVVEGVFDVFGVERAGYAAVATFGKGASGHQLQQLQRFSKVVVMYDSDASEYAYKVAHELGSHASVAVLEGDDDPGSLSPGKIRDIVDTAPLADSPDGLSQLFNLMV